jgi:hypothetical protein
MRGDTIENDCALSESFGITRSKRSDAASHGRML